MKFSLKYFLFTLAILSATITFAQVGIGTNTPAASAALEVNSTTNNQGILIPRITDMQKDAISNPAEGLMVYQTSAPTGFYFYTGNSWILLVSQTDLELKVTKVSGKGLSSNDYTTAEKTKLAFLSSNFVDLTTNQTIDGAKQFQKAATNFRSTIAGTSTIDFSQSNLASTSVGGNAPTYTLSNMKDGGAYTLVLTSTSSSGSPTFIATGFSTINYMGTGAITSGKKHIYSFIVVGTEIYVTMATQN